MSQPEAPKGLSEVQYPYHPEAWQVIGDLTDAALVKVELITDPKTADSFMANRWRVPRWGFSCLLEQPMEQVSSDTIHTLCFEDDVPGYRYFGRQPFISAGRRRPVPRRDNPRNYGILEYSKAQGLVKEPKGRLPNNYIRVTKHTADINDPEQRIIGIEDLLKDLLSYTDRGWEEIR